MPAALRGLHREKEGGGERRREGGASLCFSLARLRFLLSHLAWTLPPRGCGAKRAAEEEALLAVRTPLTKACGLAPDAAGRASPLLLAPVTCIGPAITSLSPSTPRALVHYSSLLFARALHRSRSLLSRHPFFFFLSKKKTHGDRCLRSNLQTRHVSKSLNISAPARE